VPTVTLISPASGSVIERSEALVVDVTDPLGFTRIVMSLRFNALAVWEIAHDGTTFAPRYAARSTVAVIVNGFRFSMVRDTGWPEAPQAVIYAVNTAGVEV
jgi:hypothetical protein